MPSVKSIPGELPQNKNKPMPSNFSLVDLEAIHHVSNSVLSRYRREGIDVHDSRSIVEKIFSLRVKPPEWIATFDAIAGPADSNSTHYQRLRKLKAEAVKIELHNDRAKGDSYAKADCEAIQLAWSAALNLGFTEMLAMLPPQLAGLDESGLEKRLSEEFRKLQTHLSDLESELWEKIYQQFNTRQSDEPNTATKGTLPITGPGRRPRAGEAAGSTAARSTNRKAKSNP